jgi:hypothetical protein
LLPWRYAQNVAATGRADGSPGRTTPPARASLDARFSEIRAHAQALLEPGQHGDLPTWLSESLIIASRFRAPLTPTTDDHAVSAHARAQMRRGWLRLGGRELLIDRELSGDTPTGVDTRPPGCHGRRRDRRGHRARDARRRIRFAARLGAPHDRTQRPRRVCLRALRDDTDAAQQAHEILIDRLQRVVVALWLTDDSSAPHGC